MMNEQENERMQVKCNYDIGRLHIQGVSSTVERGRKYGIALKMRAHDDVSLWLREQPAILESAASGELMYIPFDILRYEGEVYQMFIAGSKANHPEGAMLDLQMLDKPVQEMIEFATEAKMIIDVVGPVFKSGMIE
tara:strand:+ start:462 stop:869 length:408 start_codon:yes stop_codon:yes gene_type:complete